MTRTAPNRFLGELGQRLFLALLLCAPLSLCRVDHLQARVAASASKPAATRPSEDEIRRAVRQLNHPSLTQRRAAIRQLAEWGPLAFPELRRASTGGSLEAALSSRELLAELESAILIGADVQLEADKAQVAWDEPLKVTVRASNPTAGPLRVPWAAPSAKPGDDSPAASTTRADDSQAPSAKRGDDPDPGPPPRTGEGVSTATQPAEITHFEQVARMMDAADFLVVTGPDGRRVELRVEPIDRDPDVYRAVDIRARGTPPSHLVPAGEAARLDIPLFNRGWARYPLLAAGRYTIQFEYQPQWRDPTWTKEGFGCVRGQPITIEVTGSAPPPVRRGNTPLKLDVRRVGSNLEAVLESTWDLPLWVNTNLGGVPKTHGRLNWQLMQTNRDNAEPVLLEAVSGRPAFDPAKVVPLRPGGSLGLSMVPVEQVQGILDGITADRHLSAKDFSIQVHYAWLSNPTELRDVLSERGLTMDVPTEMFSGAVSVDVPADGLLGKPSRPSTP